MQKTRIFPLLLLIVFSLLPRWVDAQTTSNLRFTSSEMLVTQSLRTLHGAESTYFATYGNGNYGMLAQLGDVQFIDSALASGLKYGYSFTVVLTTAGPTSPALFQVNATPRKYRVNGRYSFLIDTTGIIRGADKAGQPATIDDPVLDVDLCSSGSIAGNERCTISSLRTLHGAESTYFATHGNGSYAGLTELGRVNLINGILATGLIHGYSISVVVYPSTTNSPAEFRIIAIPQIYGVTGIRSFYIGTEGVIYGADKNGRPASENDPPLDS